MSSQTGGGPALPATAATAASDQGEAGPSQDQGVPVGAADVAADIRQGRAEADEDSADDEIPASEGADVAEQSDSGVPVGAADAEEDRLRASDDG